MNACSSSGFISSFCLGTGVVGGSGGKGTEIGARTLIGGEDVSASLPRNLMLSMFLEREIHPSMPMGMVDDDLFGYLF